MPHYLDGALHHMGFFKEKEGNVAVVFALTLPVLAGMVLGVVDYTGVQTHKERLQNAVDASAIAAASHVDLSLTADPARLREDHARSVFRATLATSPLLSDAEFNYQDNDPLYTVEATAKVEPFFGFLAFQTGWSVTVDATAERRTWPTEMALAIDSTSSMQITGSWSGARDLLISAISYLRSAIVDEEDLYMSLVPFTDRVHVGGGFQHWLGSNPPPDWQGCFRPREEVTDDFPHALTDAPPGELPFDYSHEETEPAWNEVRWGGLACRSEITTPTTDLETISRDLGMVTTGGTGRFDEGLAWAWRLVSPRWTGLWGPAEYPAAAGAAQKVVIYIADGKASVNQPMDEGGMGEHDQLPPSGRNIMSQGHADHIIEICRKMREQGIRLYMIAPKVTLQIMEDTMLDCVQDATDYFHVTDDAEFEVALENIVTEISRNVRLVD